MVGDYRTLPQERDRDDGDEAGGAAARVYDLCDDAEGGDKDFANDGPSPRSLISGGIPPREPRRSARGTATLAVADDDDHHGGAVEGAPLSPLRRGVPTASALSRASRGAFRRLRTEDEEVVSADDGNPPPSRNATGGDGDKGHDDPRRSETSTPTTAGTTADAAMTRAARMSATDGVAWMKAVGRSDKGDGMSEDEFANDGDDIENGVPQNPFEIGTYSSDDDLNLEDDLVDDDEDSLGRYAFDFSSSVLGPSPSKVAQHHLNGKGDASQTFTRYPLGTDHRHPSSSGSSSANLRRISAPLQNAAGRMRAARMERRRKRAEAMLALPDDGLGLVARAALWCGTWCDLAERGIMVVLAAAVGLVLTYRLLGDAEERVGARRMILFVGVPLIVVRLGWRAIYWAAWGRRVERLRRMRIQVYDGLNRENSTGGTRIPESSSMDMDDGSEVGSLTLINHLDRSDRHQTENGQSTDKGSGQREGGFTKSTVGTELGKPRLLVV